MIYIQFISIMAKVALTTGTDPDFEIGGTTGKTALGLGLEKSLCFNNICSSIRPSAPPPKSASEYTYWLTKY